MYREAEWDVKNPKWTGQLQIAARNDQCVIKFVNANGSGLNALTKIVTA